MFRLKHLDLLGKGRTVVGSSSQGKTQMGESGLQGVHMGGVWTEGETYSGTGDEVHMTSRGRQGTGVPEDQRGKTDKQMGE